MYRALCAALVAVVTLAACSGAAEPPTASEQVGARPAPSPEPPPIAPLTGQEIDGEQSTRPVLAVKVDNAPAAAPQVALDQADIVVEEEVEGGITRFIALFQSSDPGEVGPVRSGREVDADLLPAFSPALVISGAAEPVDQLFADAGLVVLSDGGAGAEAFSRRDDRPSPSNLFASTEALWAAAEEAAPLEQVVWAFSEQPPAGGVDTAAAAVEFSTSSSATWTWSENEGTWLREQNGEQHVTAEGEQLDADNVVLMRVRTGPGDRQDSAGNPTVAVDVIGEGEAVILRDGVSFEGRWRKTSADAQLEWLDADGQPLPLRPGRTWIEMPGSEAELTVDAVSGTESDVEAATESGSEPSDG